MFQSGAAKTLPVKGGVEEGSEGLPELREFENHYFGKVRTLSTDRFLQPCWLTALTRKVFF